MEAIDRAGVEARTDAMDRACLGSLGGLQSIVGHRWIARPSRMCVQEIGSPDNDIRWLSLDEQELRKHPAAVSVI